MDYEAQSSRESDERYAEREREQDERLIRDDEDKLESLPNEVVNLLTERD